MPLAQWYYTSTFQARLAAFFGRRGTFLAAYGLIWIVIGIANFIEPMERFSKPGPGGPLEILEMAWTGLIWAACGLMAISTAFIRRSPGRQRVDQWGFTALLIPALVWDFGFFWSWISWLSTGVYGRPTAWLGILVYLVIVLSILVVAGWPDPADEDVDGGLQ
jgi:magnesium-transporting ATPase (P-type)